MLRKIANFFKSPIYWFVIGHFDFIVYLKLLILKDQIYHRNRIYILVYHRIINSQKNKIPHHLKSLFINKRKFELQIKYLSKKYSVISLDILLLSLQGKIKLPPVSLAITFDDGYKDNYLNAYPILIKYKVPATIFLVNNYIGKRYVGKRNKFGNYLSWNEIKKMKANLITFGSHTQSHPLLTQLGNNQLKEEIYNSKLEIEKKIGTKVLFFAYPYGESNKAIKVLAKKAGYLAAFSVDNGQEDDLFNLKRIVVRG